MADGMLGSAIRTLRLAALPAGAVLLALQGSVRRLAGQDCEQVRRRLRARNVERTRRALGDLNGGALKAGQLLSTVEALFPADPEESWREGLTALQEANPGMPWPHARTVLAAELGEGWLSRFVSFDAVPVAAASIGQVHRARWDDGTPGGRDVAVKVQYPGVREAILTDVRVLSATTRLAAVVARGVALPPLVRELRTRLLEELDYTREAEHQRAFHAVYAAAGSQAQRDAGGSPADRDRAAVLYQRFLLSGPERVGLLHTDPHPGNFRLLADGRLGVLDFGSCLQLPGGLPRSFGRLIAALLAGGTRRCWRRCARKGSCGRGSISRSTSCATTSRPSASPRGTRRSRTHARGSRASSPG